MNMKTAIRAVLALTIALSAASATAGQAPFDDQLAAAENGLLSDVEQTSVALYGGLEGSSSDLPTTD